MNCYLDQSEHSGIIRGQIVHLAKDVQLNRASGARPCVQLRACNPTGNLRLLQPFKILYLQSKNATGIRVGSIFLLSANDVEICLTILIAILDMICYCITIRKKKTKPCPTRLTTYKRKSRPKGWLFCVVSICSIIGK